MSDYVEMLNLCATPNGTQRSSYGWNVDSRQEESGKWSYMVKSGDRATFTFKMGVTKLNVGDVLVCIYSCDNPALLTVPRGASLPRIATTNHLGGAAITDRIGWVAGSTTAITGSNELWIERDCGWVTLEGAAAFSPEDWEHVYDLYQRGELTRPWFDGDTYPRNGGGASAS